MSDQKLDSCIACCDIGDQQRDIRFIGSQLMQSSIAKCVPAEDGDSITVPTRLQVPIRIVVLKFSQSLLPGTVVFQNRNDVRLMLPDSFKNRFWRSVTSPDIERHDLDFLRTPRGLGCREVNRQDASHAPEGGNRNDDSPSPFPMTQQRERECHQHEHDLAAKITNDFRSKKVSSQQRNHE